MISSDIDAPLKEWQSARRPSILQGGLQASLTLHLSQADIRVGAARLKETSGVQSVKILRNAHKAGEQTPANAKD
jgi:hypothetical protein